MNKCISFFITIACICMSCSNKTDLSDIEQEIDNLKSIVALQSAYQTQKEIISPIQKASTKKYVAHWLISFSDNTTLRITSSIV